MQIGQGGRDIDVSPPKIPQFTITVRDNGLYDPVAEWKKFLSPLMHVDRLITDKSNTFPASATVYHLGTAILLFTRSNSVRYSRSRFKVRRDDLDHFILHMPQSGAAAFVASNMALRLRRFDIALAGLGDPLDIAIGAGAAVSLILPRTRLAPLLEGADELHGLRLAGTTPAGALLGRHLLTLARHASKLRVDEARACAEATARLAAACLTVRAPRDTVPSLSAARPGLAQRVRDHIEANIHDPRLGPERLARAFHLSRSQLYRLFERRGGVHHYIRGRRLHRALDLVCTHESPARRIGDIAYSLGITNEAHFSRIFHERFGLSPRAARAAARRGDAEWLPAEAAGGEGNPLGRWLQELAVI